MISDHVMVKASFLRIFLFGIYMASIGGMCDVYILYYGYEGVKNGLTYPLMATSTFKDHSSTLDYSYPWDWNQEE